MWSIAICDDNRRVCYEMEELSETYCGENNIAVKTDIFFDGIELYEKMNEGQNYDLVFLDIIMCKMNGIEVGEKIRRRLHDDRVQLIYLTCVTDHADLLIRNRPVGYVGKPIRKDEVYQAMDDARREREEKRAWFSYRKERMIYQVPYREILYFRSIGRKVEIHMVDEVREFYGKLSDIMEARLPRQFVQIHQSYIINQDYISSIGKERVYLKGQEGYFSISHPYRQAVKRRA